MKTKTKMKVFALIAGALALCLALVGCGGSSKADPKKAFVGTWELTEISGATEDDMALLKAFGMAVEAALAEDGTFKMGMFGENLEGTWEAKSAEKITLTIEGESLEGTLKDGKLNFTIDGDGMTFKKTTDEVKDLSTTTGFDWGGENGGDDGYINGGGTDNGGDDGEEIRLVDKMLVNDDVVTIAVISMKKDWMGDCGYVLRIANNTSDTTIDVNAAYNTWSVGNRMVSPYLYETLKPGTYTEAFMYFSGDTVASLDDLISADGRIDVMDTNTYDTLGQYDIHID